MALKWVKDNIEKFGGNPGAVTLFGGCAGGASIGYHLLSEQSKGLFNQAIMVSGAPTAKWAYMSKESAAKRGDALFYKLGCTGSPPWRPDRKKLLNCPG